jgi:hypothetical protein
MNVVIFHQSLGALGLFPLSCSSSGDVTWKEGCGGDVLASLVFASIDKPLDSKECLALQKMLGPESKEWAAYVAERDRPIKEQREQRYINATNSLFFKAFEDFKVGSPEFEEALDKWKEAKSKIRAELPYLSEVKP